MIAAFVLAAILLIPAMSSADEAATIARHKKDYQELLDNLNYKCQSEIKGSADWDACVKIGNSPNLCRSIFDAKWVPPNGASRINLPNGCQPNKLPNGCQPNKPNKNS